MPGVDLVEYHQTQAQHLPTLTGVLRRRWYVVLLAVLVPAAALAFSLTQEDEYSAGASVLFRDIGGGSQLASEDVEREAATNIEVLSLETIKDRVSQKLGGGQATAESVEAQQAGKSNILEVTAHDPSPRVAARTANAYAQEYVAFRRQAELAGVRAQQEFVRGELAQVPVIERTGTEARNLRRELRRLEFEGTRSFGAARVISPARPPVSPSAPKPVRNTIIGAVVGLFLAGIAALLFERLDPRLRTPKEAEAALERPILGLVRNSRGLSRPVSGKIPTADFDDFMAIRSYLRYASPNGEIRSVLITSGAAGDGKTTVAWNLASAAAAPGRKVLLLEADLRDPTLAAALGVTPERGLADVVAGRADLQDVVREVGVTGANGSGAPARIVTVAFAGSGAGRSADLLDWERLGAVIKESEREYDLIVIDTAPLISVSDAVPLLAHVGGVIVIGRLGKTPRGALARLREQLEAVRAPTVGVVVNAVGKDATYGYGYGEARDG